MVIGASLRFLWRQVPVYIRERVRPPPDSVRFHKLYLARRASLIQKIEAATSGIVQDGPFAGMSILPGASWADGDNGSKLIGLYEAELFSVIEQAISAEPDVVVNVGCAEGYYAVGLARRLPAARVRAYDTSAVAQEMCVRNARANGVAERLTIRGLCTPGELELIAGASVRPLFVIDCEGGEKELLLSVDPRSLASATIVVECHECIVPGITQSLREIYSATHNVATLVPGGRNPNVVEAIGGWSEDDCWFVISERRQRPMAWIVCTMK